MSVPGLTHTANGKKQALAASRKANAPAPLQSKVEEDKQQQQQSDQASGSHGGRPSRQDYDREQESIKAEIEKLQQKSVSRHYLPAAPPCSADTAMATTTERGQGQDPGESRQRSEP